MIDSRNSLVGNSSADAVSKIGNRYEMVLAASARARELGAGYYGGHLPKVITDSGPKIAALQEIEEGLISVDYVTRHMRQVDNYLSIESNKKMRYENGI